MTTYRNSGGHVIVPLPLNPIEVYTESDMDYINPGQIVKTESGNHFTVTEIRHITGRMYKVVLLPVT